MSEVGSHGSYLRAPFPWFGGKSRAAALIWERLGDVSVYVEPFAGSLAVLLGRPTPARIETVNDADAMVANFWRAVAWSPEETARWADWPVSEPDLHARHLWLVERLPAHREQLMREPDYFDAKIAGWWAWGLSQWIGRGWCSGRNTHRQLPNVGGGGPACAAGKGGYSAGNGVHSNRAEGLYAWFLALQKRLRRVRVCCGDWARIMVPSILYGPGVTGVLLDPPYGHAERDKNLYAVEDDVAADVHRWALEHGDDPRLRIALCGYGGAHQMPATWERSAWRAVGGYGLQSEGRARGNRNRETVWFSPHCARSGEAQLTLAAFA